MDTMNALLTRQSIREYTNQAIPDKLIEKLLTAAMQAPSAGNQQPWQFVIVTDRTQLNALADVLKYGKMLRTAPAAVIVCGDLNHELHAGFWVQDCSAATENLLLAAHDQGLGAVWLGVYPVQERVEAIGRILGLPENVFTLSIVPLGYPAARPTDPQERFAKSRVHRNHW